MSVHEDLVSIFVERATMAGATVLRARLGELSRVLEAALSGANLGSVIYHKDVVNSWPNLGSFLGPARCESLVDDDLFGAEVGITSAEAGIAETGTVICGSGPGRSRLISLAPPVHVALLDEHDILADLLDYFLIGIPVEVPSCLNLITGPSKTADIEGILVTGVHGPGRLVVLVVSRDDA